jgi:hypothetical protein
MHAPRAQQPCCSETWRHRWPALADFKLHIKHTDARQRCTPRRGGSTARSKRADAGCRDAPRAGGQASRRAAGLLASIITGLRACCSAAGPLLSTTIGGAPLKPRRAAGRCRSDGRAADLLEGSQPRPVRPPHRAQRAARTLESPTRPKRHTPTPNRSHPRCRRFPAWRAVQQSARAPFSHCPIGYQGRPSSQNKCSKAAIYCSDLSSLGRWRRSYGRWGRRARWPDARAAAAQQHGPRAAVAAKREPTRRADPQAERI